jgi:hypothetical protein
MAFIEAIIATKSATNRIDEVARLFLKSILQHIAKAILNPDTIYLASAA